jgi:hypothetical protein
MSVLKPEQSLGVGLATATMVYAIYANATPTIADIRVAKPGDNDINASRKMASWTAAFFVSGISLITKDVTIFTIGALSIVAIDWWHRHANEVNPATGKASVINGYGAPQVEADPTGLPMGYEDDGSSMVLMDS